MFTTIETGYTHCLQLCTYFTSAPFPIAQNKGNLAAIQVANLKKT